MDYKKLIKELLKQISDEKFLRFIYKICLAYLKK